MDAQKIETSEHGSEPALMHMGFRDYRGQDVHRLVLGTVAGEPLRFVWPFLTDQEATVLADRVVKRYGAKVWSLARILVPHEYPQAPLHYARVAWS